MVGAKIMLHQRDLHIQQQLKLREVHRIFVECQN